MIAVISGAQEIWKEAVVVVKFKVLSRHLSEEKEELTVCM
jgi:hypothetical protein